MSLYLVLVGLRLTQISLYSHQLMNQRKGCNKLNWILPSLQFLWWGIRWYMHQDSSWIIENDDHILSLEMLIFVVLFNLISLGSFLTVVSLVPAEENKFNIRDFRRELEKQYSSFRIWSLFSTIIILHIHHSPASYPEEEEI